MVGLTTELPNDVSDNLCGEDAGPHDWLFWMNIIRNYSDTPDHRSLNGLTPSQTVGLLVTPKG